MAAQAAVLADERPVHPVFAECFVDHGAVTSPAQLISRLFDPQRVRRRSFLMALVAHFIGDGLMNGLIKHPAVV